MSTELDTQIYFILRHNSLSVHGPSMWHLAVYHYSGRCGLPFTLVRPPDVPDCIGFKPDIFSGESCRV
jgi:hypothetical protein